ncbi:hypothetical protein SCHPADRAFT_832836 [Schizopora paradoxa]|uniref:Uncharacterized protein n=1 Tax=Schizopora paradoxa TaxID=27342 RepID=A0A0H2RF51_9AGAM|nr:hypothetical protein SCHPADRAFT_832836 [Schizopora paradoxa]
MLVTNRLEPSVTFSTFPFLAVATPQPQTHSSQRDTGTVQCCDICSPTEASYHCMITFFHCAPQTLIDNRIHRLLA